MPVQEFTLICFDIAHDKRRRKAVTELESWGHRAQESVFECWLSEEERQTLRRRLMRIIDAGEDRIALYTLAAGDVADIRSYGSGLPSENFRHAIL